MISNKPIQYAILLHCLRASLLDEGYYSTARKGLGLMKKRHNLKSRFDAWT
jgi:hypothetical protein